MPVDDQVGFARGLPEESLLDSMNVAFLNFPSKTMKVGSPRLVIVEIMLRGTVCRSLAPLAPRLSRRNSCR
jgi:hypothetical protein